MSLIEREDEIAEEHVGAGLDEGLGHAEAVQRADHQHVLAAQVDPEVFLHEAHRLALERVLQAAAVDDRRDLGRLEQAQTVAQRVAVARRRRGRRRCRPSRSRRPCRRVRAPSRSPRRACRPRRRARCRTPRPSRSHDRAMIAGARSQRYRDDLLHLRCPLAAGVGLRTQPRRGFTRCGDLLGRNRGVERAHAAEREAATRRHRFHLDDLRGRCRVRACTVRSALRARAPSSRSCTPAPCAAAGSNRNPDPGSRTRSKRGFSGDEHVAAFGNEHVGAFQRDAAADVVRQRELADDRAGLQVFGLDRRPASRTSR